MQDSLSVTETAKLLGTTRQTIASQIGKGNIIPEIVNLHQTFYRLTPEMIAEFAQRQFSGLIGIIGVFLFTEIAHQSGLISDDVYDKAKTVFKNTVIAANEIEAMRPMIKRMIKEYPFMRDAMRDK
jgi:hypothetical protein